jgi:hypothetical protein
MGPVMLLGLRRQSLWILAVLVMLGAGYTAGYVLAPPKHAAVSLTLPATPVEAPPPAAPLETGQDDA